MKPLRILKLCNLFHTELIRDFYRRRPEQKDLSYEEQKQYLVEYCPVHLNGFSIYMRELGHECEEIIFDSMTIQKTWAKENDCTYGSNSWQLDIVMEQIKSYAPDVLYLQDVNGLPLWIRRRIKDLVPSIKLVAVFKGYPGLAHELTDIDVLFAGSPVIGDDYRAGGVNAIDVYHSFDPRVLAMLQKHRHMLPREDYELSFLGYSGFGGGGIMHYNRYQMLCELAERTNIQMWVTESPGLRAPDLDPEDLPLLERYPERTTLSCFGLEMYNILNRSKMVFNVHTLATLDVACNMRMFEATGAGTCLITDQKRNLADLFEPDKEVVVYNSIEECIEKINYLNENEKERAAIAKAGQERTLKDHALPQRCERISYELQELMKGVSEKSYSFAHA
tara:strand:- start:30233 stop:31408 length:1176 start_codon:yes stop_codon:yes gene_type:complete